LFCRTRGLQLVVASKPDSGAVTGGVALPIGAERAYWDEHVPDLAFSLTMSAPEGGADTAVTRSDFRK
jgi:hypothetical protein